MFSTRMLLPLVALAGVGYLLFYKSARFLGDKAQVGDDVFVPVDPTTAAIPGLPAGVAQLMIHVTGTSGSDVLTGIVNGAAIAGAANFIPLPQIEAASVERRKVTAIMRSGKTITL